MSTVGHTLDTLPPLTDELRAELEALDKKLADRPDSEIDLTDSPEITPERWAKAVINPRCAVVSGVS